MSAIVSKKSINSLFKNFGFLLSASVLTLILSFYLLQYFESNLLGVILFYAIWGSAVFFFIHKKRNEEALRLIAALKTLKDSAVNKTAEDGEIQADHEVDVVLQKLIGQISGDFKYLNKLEKMRSEFLGNVSHELKTPIFAIQGFLETLLNGAIDDESVNKSYLQKAAAHTEKLNQLVTDLIDISMIETGQMRMSFRFFDLSAYLNEIHQDFLPMVKSKNLQFELSSVNPKLSVFGDKNRLTQVFSNLISNAVKYTDHGHVKIEVTEFADFAQISVIDTGIGISEDDLPRVFERFYRVDKARSREMGGTGLGLSIVKHILERHQSKFELSSEMNNGTRFTFTLRK